MQNKALRRNLLAAIIATAAQTLTSKVEENYYGRGVRLYVTIASPTATGTNDSLYLCAQVPGTATVIPLTGFIAANMLSTAGTYAFDFYPGAWLPPAGIGAAGQLLGTAGIHLPISWAVQAIFGAGNHSTITIDAEVLP